MGTLVVLLTGGRAPLDPMSALDLLSSELPRALRSVLGAQRFEWCKRAHRSAALGHDIVRADYRLSELGLPDEELAALRQLSGLRDIGFAVFGGAARLGPVTDPAAFSRATEVIVLLHGMWGSRETWRQLSAACCRANGQAIVIAPDLFGFGESRFTAATPRPEHLAPATLPRSGA